MIGNWHEGPNGWAMQLCNHILSLDKAGVTVVPRRLNITGIVNKDISPRILELEQNDSSGIDLIILNTLPSLYERNYKKKTVGYYVCETSHFRQTDWAKKINLMDAALVPCFFNKESSLTSGVKVPIHIVPQAIDLEKTTKNYSTTQVRQQNPDKFIFYTISEWTTRKNVDAIVKAFHLAFSPREPVELLIKTTPVGLGDNPQQTLSDKIDSIKRGLKLYENLNQYKRENVICGFSSDEEICSIHQSGDCFVTASRAEAFNIPLAEALAFGKIIIAPFHGGMDYITEKNSYMVDTFPQNCFGAGDSIPDIYVGSELWNEVNIPHLVQRMREAFTKKDLNRRKVEQCRKDSQQFSYENVGNIYKKTLEKLV